MKLVNLKMKKLELFTKLEIFRINNYNNESSLNECTGLYCEMAIEN